MSTKALPLIVLPLSMLSVTPGCPCAMDHLAGDRWALCDHGDLTSCAFSPTMPLLAVAGRKGRSEDGLLMLYDVKSGRELAAKRHPSPSRGEFLAIAFSPDGDVLAAADEGGQIVLWRIVQRGALSAGYDVEKSRAFSVPRYAISLAFSPDGKLIAAGCSDGLVRVLDTRTGKTVRELSGHCQAVTAVAWSPDGSLLAAGGMPDGTVTVWAGPDFAPVAHLARGSAVVTGLAFLPNSRLAAAYCGDLTTKYREVKMEHADEQVRIWSLVDGRLERSLFAGGDGVASLSASADGKLLAAAYTHRAGGQNWVAVLESSTGHPLSHVEGNWSEPHACWSASERILAVVDGRVVEPWDLRDPVNPCRKWHMESFWYDTTEME